MRPWERIFLWIFSFLLISGCMVACLAILWFYYPVLLEKNNQNRLETPSSAESKSWPGIQAAGKIRVGVSPDFAPFSYYNGAVQFDGFEPVLMVEIGKKLGVAVEFHDFAAEGLASAVSAGQLDAGLGTLKNTSENQALVDFSLPYYSNEDAVLVRKGSSVANFVTLDQLSSYRVGVKAGSVYEALVMKYLVGPGRLPEANVLHAGDLDQAIEALIEGKVDLVYLGLESARMYMMGGGLELTGMNLAAPAYAVAYTNGDSELGERIDRALRELEKEGTLDELARRYLGMDDSEELAELPRPRPGEPAAVIPPAPPACVDVSAFLGDLNFPSQPADLPIQVAAGQVFKKGWKIQNSGSCSWSGSYRLVFAFGDSAQARMSGQPTNLPAVVTAGQAVDVYANLVAPTTAGVYRGYWNLVNARNQAFGERLPVTIEVNPELEATLPVDQLPVVVTETPSGSENPPSSNIYFMATPMKINPGEDVTFVWKVEMAKQVYFYTLGQDYLTHPVPTNGTLVERPAKSATYELRAILLDNTMITEKLNIDVTVNGEGPPLIYEFAITPPRQITIGQCVAITWWVDVRATEVRLRRDNAEIWRTTTLSSNYTDCPSRTGDIHYSLEAISAGGMSVRTASLGVYEKPQPPPPTAVPPATWTPVPPVQPTPTFTPTATSAPPAVIDYFTAEPTEVKVGECSLLRWKTSGGSAVVTLWRSGMALLTGAPGAATAQDCYQRDGPVTYRLTAENASGEVEQRELVVTVKP